MRSHNEYVIRPISTGFLVQDRDSKYYGGSESAFSTWEEVLDFIKNDPPTFYVEEASPSTNNTING